MAIVSVCKHLLTQHVSTPVSGENCDSSPSGQMKDELHAGHRDLTRVPAAGTIWHTLLAFGANFDYDGLYNFRGLSWPASFMGTSLQSLADAQFYHCGSLDAYKDLFRTGGKTWATLRDIAAAHAHFKEIKGTGVLGIFPFGQESTTLKVPAVVQANSCPVHNKCRHAICTAGAGLQLRW